jgi:hypothetical protein
VLEKIPEQIKRLSIVIAVIIAVVISARFVVLPSALVDTQYHRASTVQREVAKNNVYAGATVCGNCHPDQMSTKSKGYHKNVSCETCHGPAQSHTENPSNKPSAPRGREFCVFCHAYDPSRPTGFPQINPVVHNPLKPCTTCHKPHDPVPPESPRECSACHAQIANIKSASPHALVGCPTCHTVPEKHKTNPLRVRPTKPMEREFCAKCHAKQAGRKDAPSVDFNSHGDRFLCWECHYPHLPERTVQR